MSMIVFCIPPMHSTANCHLKLAKTLQRRGHDVVFLGLPVGKEFIASSGFEFRVVFSHLRGIVPEEREDELGWWATMAEEARDLRKSYEYLASPEAIEEFRGTIDNPRPDLVLIDPSTVFSVTWALLAYRCGFLCHYVSPTLPMSAAKDSPPLSSSALPDRLGLRTQFLWQALLLKRWLNIRFFTALGIGIDWKAASRRVARSCGYPSKRLNTSTYMPPMVDFPELYLVPEEFDFPRRCPDRWFNAEASIDLERSDPEFPWSRIETSKKLIFCALGTLWTRKRFLQAVVDAAAAQSGWQLVLSLGAELQPADLRNVPADAILVQYAPQLELLKRADCMITHGGANSVKECIFFGVPMVVVPIAFDAPGIAARVRMHGLGVVLQEKAARSSRIEAAVREILEESAYRDRVRSMSKIFRRLESEERAANYIEGFLRSNSSGSPVALGAQPGTAADWVR